MIDIFYPTDGLQTSSSLITTNPRYSLHIIKAGLGAKIVPHEWEFRAEEGRQVSRMKELSNLHDTKLSGARLYSLDTNVGSNSPGALACPKHREKQTPLTASIELHPSWRG